MTVTDTEPLDATDALNIALASTHAAVHGYGFVGAHATDEDRDRATEDLDAHRTQRDLLREAVLDRDGDPVPAESTYPIPADTDATSLAEFAAELERAVGESVLQLVGASDVTARELGYAALQQATVRRLRWEANPPVFPGYPQDARPV